MRYERSSRPQKIRVLRQVRPEVILALPGIPIIRECGGGIIRYRYRLLLLQWEQWTGQHRVKYALNCPRGPGEQCVIRFAGLDEGVSLELPHENAEILDEVGAGAGLGVEDRGWVEKG